MNQPNRIMAALTPKRAMSAATSVMPMSIAISTIMSEDETEYSTQRARLMPRSRSAT